MEVKGFTKIIEHFSDTIHLDKNYDINCRLLNLGNRRAAAYFINGMTNDDLAEKILQALQGVKSDEMANNAAEFIQKFVPNADTKLVEDEQTVITALLSGLMVIYVEGYAKWVVIDCRNYPGRSVDEPEKDKVLRGSRDGFVENIMANTALIRRRIRSSEFCAESMTAGQSSKTDIAICYVRDRVDKKLLADIKKRIKAIKTDALTMNHQSLAECLYSGMWFNPFPKVKYSERPDTAASSVLKGNIVIIIDNSPSVMILPTSLFDIIEEANDYYFPPITGNYLRFSRFLINFITVFLTPVFLLLMKNPEAIPKTFDFIKVNDVVNIPLIFQFLILELCIDGLRIAAMNTPNILTTPLSIIAAIVFGEFSVESGWFNSQAMLYMAFVAVGNYSQASYEFGYALKFMRILLLILVELFDIWGFIAGCIVMILSILLNKTISGKSYLYPLIPFKWGKLKKKIVRSQISNN